MGEKIGGLTNMVIVIVVVIGVLLVVQSAFPELNATVVNGMYDIVNTSTGAGY